MTAMWDNFRNSGSWPYETTAEAERRVADRLAALEQATETELPGLEAQPDGGDPPG